MLQVRHRLGGSSSLLAKGHPHVAKLWISVTSAGQVRWGAISAFAQLSSGFEGKKNGDLMINLVLSWDWFPLGINTEFAELGKAEVMRVQKQIVLVKHGTRA